MTESSITKTYDLEERTLRFAKHIGLFCKTLPRTVTNAEYGKQVIRSASSIGANYIEANEALSKKDFALRIRISRKEAKETAYWLQLIIAVNSGAVIHTAHTLFTEAIELKKILSAIVEKTR